VRGVDSSAESVTTGTRLLEIDRARISLRPPVPADEPFLLALYASTRAEELAITGWSEAEQDAFCRMQFAAQTRFYNDHYPHDGFSLLLVDGEPAGRLYVARLPGELRVVDIALMPRFRGRGIGSSLFASLFEESRSTGLPVRIHVEVFNRARRLYERLGFRQIADRGVYVEMEWRPPATGDSRATACSTG
jgi:ribosomal protein S18 acetylase RimI-like enzyme